MILLIPNNTEILTSENYQKLLSKFKLNNSTELLHNYLLLGFEYSTKHPLTLGLNNLIKNKYNITFYSEFETKKNNISDFSKFFNLYSNILSQIKQTYSLTHPIFFYESAGVRATWNQLKQLIGMRGFLTNLSNKNLQIPILKGFNKGLSLFEFILSCYGARKGLVESSIKTADAGYLTRRLVEQLQSFIIKEFDCFTSNSYKISFNLNSEGTFSTEIFNFLIGKTLAANIYKKDTGILLYKKNTILNYYKILDIINTNSIYSKFYIFSPGTCNSNNSICKTCFGFLNTNINKLETKSIGILAAQSIGEPATQLTLRTFHFGGIFKPIIKKNKYLKEKVISLSNFYYLSLPILLNLKKNQSSFYKFDISDWKLYKQNCGLKTYNSKKKNNEFSNYDNLVLKYFSEIKQWYLFSSNKNLNLQYFNKKLSLIRGFKLKKSYVLVGFNISNVFNLYFDFNNVYILKYFNYVNKIYMKTYKTNKFYYFSSFFIFCK